MAHMPVHLSIGQTEDDRLISDEGLVVALCIADRLLLLTAVRQFVPDSTRTPLFVRTLGDELRPEVGDIHRQAVVEAEATILDGRG